MADITPISELTIAQLEDKLLASFLNLSHILEDKVANQKLKVDEESLFATAVHMSKAKNDVGAAKYMRHAAMCGHIKAQFYLGMMFAKGAGLPQSEFHAFTWLYLAESQGSIEAVEAISKLQKHLCAKQIKSAKKHAADLYESIHNDLINK